MTLNVIPIDPDHTPKGNTFLLLLFWMVARFGAVAAVHLRWGNKYKMFCANVQTLLNSIATILSQGASTCLNMSPHGSTIWATFFYR